MDLPQQVGPAALLGAVVVMVGGVEVADQRPGEVLAQRLVHHLLVPPPPQEVPFGGSGEGPDVPVDPVLPPAGLVGMHHRTAPNPLPDAPQFTLGLPGHPMDDPGQGPHAQGQLMHGLQIPLNGAAGQPGLLPESGNQADPQPLFPQHHTRQIRPGVRRCSQRGQIRAIKTCSVTWAGTAGMSMTSRVRCAQPPANPAPHSGQESRACSTRRVGVMRWREKPWRRGPV